LSPEFWSFLVAGNQKQSSSVGALCLHKRHRFSEDERIRPIEDEKLSIWVISEVTAVELKTV
jgi:hypothetical protein